MKKAVDYFHKEPEKLNCAQAVLKAWQEDFGISDETIEEFRQWGGGRAQGGVCGALFAADYLLAKEGEKLSIKEPFVAKAGFSTCALLKSSGRVPCTTCVNIADELVKKNKKECVRVLK